MIKKRYVVFSIGGAMTLFWLSSILFFLYFPRIKNALVTDHTINVFTWADMFTPHTIAQFEERTGIRVNMSYFENNEELLTKLELAQGNEYDLVTTTDYSVAALIKRGLVQKIDKNMLDFMEDLDGRLLGHYFDPTNEYSIPYLWDVYGIGYNTNVFPHGLSATDWSVIFDEHRAPHHMGIIEDGYELIDIAALYLYGFAGNYSAPQLHAIQSLLIKQRPYIEVYNEFIADRLLLSGASSLVVAQSAYVAKAIRYDRAMRFMIPKPHSFMVIDSMVIPQGSTKKLLTYQLMNYLFQEQAMQEIIDTFFYLPSRLSLLKSMDLNYLGGNALALSPEWLNQFLFFKRLVSPAVVNQILIAVKS